MHMNGRTRTTLAALALGAALVAAGCSSSGNSTGSTTPAAATSGSAAGSSGSPATGSGSGSGDAGSGTGGTFTLGLTSDPGSVYPYGTTLGTARAVFAFGYDTLVNRAPDGTVVSGLAEKWTSTADSVTYTLKSGVTCADGTALKASDVAADFTYISNPKTLSPWKGLTIPVDYTVTADDAQRTVTIKTATPFGLLLYGAGSLPIVCPAALKNPTSLDHAFGGTGPYTVKDYVAGDHYTLQARKDYSWGPDGATTTAKGQPQTVVVKFIKDETTATNLLLSGAIDATQVTGPDAARLASSEKVSVPVIAAELDYNEAAGRPFNDERVRKALTMVLPLSDIVTASTHGTGTAATNMIVETPVLCPGDVVKGSMPTGDAAAAGQLLDQAGWTVGAGGQRMKDGKPLQLKGVFFSGQTDVSSAMELIAQTWKQLGVTLNLTPVTNAVFNQTIYSTGDWDVEYAGLNVEQPYMMLPFYSGNVPPTGRNAGHVDNKQFQDLSDQAMGQTGTDSCATWNNAWKALISAADVVPISVSDRTFFLKKGSSLQKSGLFAIPTSLRVGG
jgi:peptide/nickel transport system substrate-binding protein